MSHAEEDGKYCVENTHLVQGQVIGDHIKVYNTYQPPTPHQTDPHRERMLRRLGRSYKELLDQSLHGIAWMELGLSARSDMVSNVTNLLFRLPHGGERLLAPGTSIVNAYDEAEGELLILGTPGAGKSTLLLDLARRLVDRAGTDPTYPLPVILRLSSWARERPTLETWMIEQLSQTYDISRQLSERWVTDGRLLPLLDGLDEMEAAARSACIAAINAYHHTHLTPLVVCSRHTEYEVAATRQRLALQSTVIVQPLSEAQIEGYLNAAGPSFIGVRTALQQEHTLRELATTPLMLSVLLLTYRGAAASEIVQQGTELERQVWTDYVARQIAEKGNDTRYPSERTCSWLSWLAQQMRTHNQTIFYLEYLQPGWLPEVGQRAYIWLGVLIPGIVIGGLICPVIAFFLGFLALDIELNVVRYLHIGLLGGLVGGLFSITLGENVPSLNLQFLFASDASRLRKIHLGLSILVGLVYVLCNGWDSDLSGWLSIIERVVCDVCIFGGTIGLSCWLLMRIFLYGPLQQTQSLPSRRICREGVFNRLYNHDLRRRILLVAGILGAGNGLINGLEVGFPPTNEGFMGRLGSGLGYGLITGMWFGLTGLLVCLILQRQVRDIYLTERLRWTVGSLQRSMFALKHLKATVLLICFFTLIVGGGVGLGS